jgi:hypothetical protein
MTPEHLKSKIFAPTAPPLKDKGADIPIGGREGEFDISTELVGYGLQGVKVTDDELRDLVAELGLDGDEAGDLVKGLSSSDPPEEEGPKVEESRDAEEVKINEDSEVKVKEDVSTKQIVKQDTSQQSEDSSSSS